MNKNIVIEKNVSQTSSSKARITFYLSISNSKFKLWYEFDNKYLRYVNEDVCDAVLVCLIPYAMYKGLNIKSKIPISERLFYSVNNYLIPTIANHINSYNLISVEAPCKNEKYNAYHTGTGVSGGVDSFYTILKNNNSHPTDSNKNIDTLCLFNVGSSGNGCEGRNLFDKRMENSLKITEELCKDFLFVDTNIDELYEDFGFEETHVFRTLSVPLLFQKYFSTYYFSSSFEASLFRFDEKDPSYYDLFILPNISTDNLSFISVGSEINRIGKVAFISNYAIAQKYLNVCAGGSFNNCCHCFKCKRTMLDLYLINRLDSFDKCFDVDLFLKHKNHYLQYAYSNRNDIDMKEIYDELKKRKEFKFRHFLVDKIITLKKLRK